MYHNKAKKHLINLKEYVDQEIILSIPLGLILSFTKIASP